MSWCAGCPVDDDNVLQAIQWIMDRLEPIPDVGDPEWEVLTQIYAVVDDMRERL